MKSWVTFLTSYNKVLANSLGECLKKRMTSQKNDSLSSNTFD